MKTETKSKRETAIEVAAYNLLQSKGYAGTSMLAVAKAAKASNETLYKWYGDKTGLFGAMVRRNVAEVKAQLDAAIDQKEDPYVTLAKIAPVLLSALMGDKAILLNRASACDPTGELGKVLGAAGRDEIAPLIGRVIAQIPINNTRMTDQERAELFITLLVGDWQIRRVIGTLPQPSPGKIASRAQFALAAYKSLT